MNPIPPDSSAPSSGPAATPTATKICAVMVTYNPDSTLEQNIRALLPQVARLIVVDNGSEPAGRAAIAAIAAACNFEVIWNNENLGLAAALNVGIRRVLSGDDYDWIATFDEDSRVSPGFSDIMLQAYASCPFRDQVALIGPCLVLFPEAPAGRASQSERVPLFRERPVMLQSGSLLSVAALRSVDLFDESFFIDYVDFEFCLRLRKHGLRIIEATNASLVHRVGAPTSHTILKHTCVVYNHGPIRRYYAARNRLRVYRRYLLSDPSWIGHDAWSWFKELIKLAFFEEDRRKKLRYMARGVWDACRGRTGVFARG